MFYRKNLPGWERAMRTIGGVAMIGNGLSGMPGTMAGYLIAGAGAIAILTGSFGFCPMCAMVGRRLPAPCRRSPEPGAAIPRWSRPPAAAMPRRWCR